MDNHSLAYPLKITYLENKNWPEPIPEGLLTYGQDLPFNILSTGEQNIINIFINLIFKTKYNSFVTIDEPEISLHMEWQLLLLRNIIRVANELDLQILVATHSPYLLESNDIEIASVEYGE
jgi:predicted ATPase